MYTLWLHGLLLALLPTVCGAADQSGGILRGLASKTTFDPLTETSAPSNFNSAEPSNVAQASFTQVLITGNGKLFDENEIRLFENLYAGYTNKIAAAAGDEVGDMDINTTCEVHDMVGLTRRHLRPYDEYAELVPSVRRNVQEEPYIQALSFDFTMSYQSQKLSVANYPTLFLRWVNSNLETVREGMQLLQLNVTELKNISLLIAETVAPATAAPTGVLSPTDAPSYENNTRTDSPIDSSPPPSQNAVITITTSLMVGMCIILVGLILYWRKRQPFTRKGKQSAARSSSLGETREPFPNDLGPAATETAENGTKDEKKVRIQEPSAPPDPTVNEKRYDDRVHYYYHGNKAKANTSSSRSSSHRNSKTQDIKTRLRQLDKLRDVITAKEYEDRRREIISEV